MMGNAKVQIMRDKIGGNHKYMVYIPSFIVKNLGIDAGHRVSFDITTHGPDKVERKGKPFQKKEQGDTI